MRRKGQVLTGLLGLMIMLIIGVVILGTVFTFLSENALSIQESANESNTLDANNMTVLDNDLATIIAIYNGTGGNDITGHCNYTTVDSTLYCNATTGSTIDVDYTWYPLGYVTGTSALIVRTLPVMLAIILFLGVAAFVAWKK